MNKQLVDLMRIIHFTEKVSARIHGLLAEAEIYRVVREEFAKSKRYNASIVLLTAGESKLKVAETSLPSEKLKAGEKVVEARLKEYQFDLSKSSTYRQVVKGGKTIQARVDEVIGELFPQPLAFLISKMMGYEKTKSILTPLKRQGKIIGVFAMTSTDLAEYLIPSVKNLAQHITNALELADEISERQRAEKALRQLVGSQKEFIAHISHELRTSLSVIKAIAEVEKDRATRSLARQLGLINKKVDQIMQILQNLRLISKLDIGQERVQKTRFKLKNLLKEVLEDVVKEAQREKIELKARLVCSATIVLTTDRAKIAEVLANLLRNAVAHSRGEPRIWVKARKHGGKVQIVVEDNNWPLAETELEKIFEKFYQSKSTRRKERGLGLGLYISKKLVELMGGKIWAESKRGIGNRFIAQLPVSSQAKGYLR